MALNLLWIIALVFGTTLIHTLCTVGVFIWLRSVRVGHWALRNVIIRAVVLAGLVFAMSIAAYLEAFASSVTRRAARVRRRATDMIPQATGATTRAQPNAITDASRGSARSDMEVSSRSDRIRITIRD